MKKQKELLKKFFVKSPLASLHFFSIILLLLLLLLHTFTLWPIFLFLIVLLIHLLLLHLHLHVVLLLYHLEWNFLTIFIKELSWVSVFIVKLNATIINSFLTVFFWFWLAVSWWWNVFTFSWIVKCIKCSLKIEKEIRFGSKLVGNSAVID